MSKRLSFTLPFDQDLNAYLASKYPDISDFRIISKSLDARRAPKGRIPKYHYQIDVIRDGESFEDELFVFDKIDVNLQKPIVILGAGPAGLFCALRLAERGLHSILVERGHRSQDRMLRIARYWRYGELDEDTNVCYGEGGAGLFSDGKLITRVKSEHIPYVMRRFVDFGAPEEIAYESNPHLGSNKIRNIISKMSDRIAELGSELVYHDPAIDIELNENPVVTLRSGRKIEASQVVLACGHSARDLYEKLHKNGLDIKSKSFALGVRIEHPREWMDFIQYGSFSKSDHLGAARYRLAWENPDTKKGTYSFCMCPGGYVLSSGTEADGIVTNGMSNYSRNSKWSNSALVVSITAGEDFPSVDPMDGFKFQEDIEKRAFQISKFKATGREIPAITLKEFMEGKIDYDQELPKNSCPSGLVKVDFQEIFPDFVIDHLRSALSQFNRKLDGFVTDKAILMAPETRTSSPVTIVRDKETLQSKSHSSIYPCGEGAGYAGGITSAAVDGVKVAESIIKKLI